MVIKKSVAPITYPCFFKHGFNKIKCPNPGIYVEIFRTVLETMNIDVRKVEMIVVGSSKELHEVLNNSLVDVSATPKEPDPITFTYLSFSKPVLYKERAYMMHSPTSKNVFKESVKMLQPFSFQLWIAIIALLILSYSMVFFLKTFSISRTTVFIESFLKFI